MRIYWPVAQHWAWCGPHRKHFFQCLFYCCVRVFRALPRNGSTCHNIKFTQQILVFNSNNKFHRDRWNSFISGRWSQTYKQTRHPHYALFLYTLYKKCIKIGDLDTISLVSLTTEEIWMASGWRRHRSLWEAASLQTARATVCFAVPVQKPC
jgi:hypothetical protein